jgi:hypothetical protein
MATKVTTYQIESFKPSQLEAQGAIPGDVLVAVQTGLTTTWSPTSVLPRNALHGQTLIYDVYTSTWKASSVNIGGGSQLPVGNGADAGKVLTWSGFQWLINPPAGTVNSVGINNTDGALTIGGTNPVTSSGFVTININKIGLGTLKQDGALDGQMLAWSTSSNSWIPNYVGGVKAFVVFNGVSNPVTSGIVAQKNITSIADNGTGDYTINFTPGTFSSTSYAFCAGVHKNDSGQFVGCAVEVSRTASSFRVNTGFVFQTNDFKNFDSPSISLVFFG